MLLPKFSAAQCQCGAWIVHLLVLIGFCKLDMDEGKC